MSGVTWPDVALSAVVAAGIIGIFWVLAWMSK